MKLDLGAPSTQALLVRAVAAAALALVIWRWLEASRWLRVWWHTRAIPCAPGCLPVFGHALTLARGCSWGQMYDWLGLHPGIARFRVGTRTGILVEDPAAIKRIVQTRQRVYTKDTDFSYREFLPILGTGLVTSEGKLWQRQRLLMAPAFRIDMLDAILPIAAHGVERLAVKLRAARDSRTPVDMEAEFRLLTLQVIGEAILSLPPEECDRVFPPLYLPVMEESNRRVLQPWRHLWPPLTRAYARNVAALDAFIKGVIADRRAARAATFARGEQPPPGDILDKVLTAVEASGEPWNAAAETQLCYEIKTFLLAGHETSAAMLCWTLYELSLQPDALAKVCVLGCGCVCVRKEGGCWMGGKQGVWVGMGGCRLGRRESIGRLRMHACMHARMHSCVRACGGGAGDVHVRASSHARTRASHCSSRPCLHRGPRPRRRSGPRRRRRWRGGACRRRGRRWRAWPSRWRR